MSQLESNPTKVDIRPQFIKRLARASLHRTRKAPDAIESLSSNTFLDPYIEFGSLRVSIRSYLDSTSFSAWPVEAPYSVDGTDRGQAMGRSERR